MPAHPGPQRIGDEDGPPGLPPEAGWPGVPDPPRQFHARPHLLDRLDADPRCCLVLVSAPAGTGKTALVADWVTTRRPERTEWVTFDEGDAFWPGLVGCLVRLGLDLPVAGLPAATAPLDTDLRRRLAVAVASLPAQVTVVVDGYDVSSAEVATDLDFLLKHSGRRLRLVLLTRADPVMPLYRYRLDETMVEVRMADLAFTDHDAKALFEVLGLRLDAAEVRRLNQRARGWVTGLRFAAKSLAEKSGTVGIEQITAGGGSIDEYLLGEVLSAHAPQVREQLMSLSIPDTIQPGLAEVLAGHRAARLLAALVHVNAFIEPVPEHPGHYRFHPFFRDLLRAELAYRSPERLRELQLRTADWFAERGLLGLAVHHQAAVGAWDLAADAVVGHGSVGRLLLDHDSSVLAHALRGIPADLDHDGAAVIRATLAIVDGDVRRADDELSRISGHRSSAAEAVRVAVRLLRAVLARDAGDPRESLGRAQGAVEERHVPAEERPVHDALARTSEAIAQVRLGRLEPATALLRRCSAGPGSPGLESLGLLALLSCSSGDLGRAEELGSRVLERAHAEGVAASERPPAAEVALAWVSAERFDLREAGVHVRAATRPSWFLPDPVSRAALAWVRARLQLVQGDRTGAVDQLRELASGLHDEDSWLVERTRLEIAHALVVRGESRAALVELAGLPPSPDTAVVAARAKIDLGDDDGAARAIELASAAESPLPVRVAATLLECERLVRLGEGDRARSTLRTALTMARGCGLRRPFHEAGPAVRRLLAREDPGQRVAADGWGSQTPPMGALDGSATHDRPAGAPIEELTAKESEVLGHLAELLTTEEIAAVMFISVNTVRTHVRNILRKFGVPRRNAAVRLAREYELLGR